MLVLIKRLEVRGLRVGYGFGLDMAKSLIGAGAGAGDIFIRNEIRIPA
jgi:hypothetical protein